MNRLNRLPELARNLRSLADIPFQIDHFSPACHSFGWQLDETEQEGAAIISPKRVRSSAGFTSAGFIKIFPEEEMNACVWWVAITGDYTRYASVADWQTAERLGASDSDDDQRIVFIVPAKDQVVQGATMRFLDWETWIARNAGYHEPVQGDKLDEDYARIRERLDQDYASFYSLVESTLGSPLVRVSLGTEPPDAGSRFPISHEYSMWQGKTALLVLRQSHAQKADLPYVSCTAHQIEGLDISFWLERWDKDEPKENDAFKEWLVETSGKWQKTVPPVDLYA